MINDAWPRANSCGACWGSGTAHFLPYLARSASSHLSACFPRASSHCTCSLTAVSIACSHWARPAPTGAQTCSASSERLAPLLPSVERTRLHHKCLGLELSGPGSLFERRCQLPPCLLAACPAAPCINLRMQAHGLRLASCAQHHCYRPAHARAAAPPALAHDASEHFCLSVQGQEF